MGNLCSSGTEREKKAKDENLPDKPRDGEDEALLQAAGSVGVGVIEGGVGGKVEAEAGDGNGGMGILGEVLEAGEAAKTDMADVVGEGVDKVNQKGDEVLKAAQGGATEAGGALSSEVEKLVSEGKSEVAGAVEEKGALEQVVEQGKGKVEEIIQQGKEKGEEGIEVVKAKVEEGKDAAQELVDSVTEKVSSSVASATAGVSGLLGGAEGKARGETEAVEDQVVSTTNSNVEAVKDEKEVALDFGQLNLDSAAALVSEVKADGKENVEKAVAGAKDQIIGGGLAVVESKVAAVGDSLSSRAESTAIPSGVVAGTVEHIKSAAQELQSSFGGVSENTEQLGEVAVQAEKESAITGAQSGESGFGGMVSGMKDSVVESITNAQESLTESAQSARDSLTMSLQGAQASFTQSSQEAQYTAAQSVTDVQKSLVASLAGGKDDVKETEESPPAAMTDSVTRAQEIVSESLRSAQETMTESAPSFVEDIDSTDVMAALGDTKERAETEVKDIAEEVAACSAVVPEMSAQGLEGIENLRNEVKEAANESTSSATQDVDDVVELRQGDSHGSFLDKAKELLEAHRNSLDGVRTLDPEGELGEQSVEEAVGEQSVEEAVGEVAQEETAREFVESIIDKATSMVSESLASEGAASAEGATPEQGGTGDGAPTMEVCVERGEETLPSTKRGVCFASPQGSESSPTSASGSASFVMSPPPGGDLSPPGNASDSSGISQGELVERDIESDFMLPPAPPPPPPQFIGNENVDDNGNDNEEISGVIASTTTDTTDIASALTSINNNNNINDNNNTCADNNNVNSGVVGDDDDSIQRVAMEVTTKAVQDAIKIVTENGTGINSPASGDAEVDEEEEGKEEEDAGEEEEMTTTDSSQVERGSPVSDLTSETSQAGSVCESLSSYDPGQAFRQDILNTVTSPVSETPGAGVTAPLPSPPPPPPPQSPSAAAAAAATPTASSSTTNANDIAEVEDGDAVETPSVVDEASLTSPLTESSTPEAGAEDVAPPPPPSHGDGDEMDGPPSPSSVNANRVPCSLAPMPDAPEKPTIVINSPDSAHHTNGSNDEAPSPPAEALI